MEIPGPACGAGGTIAPCRAVKIDTSADNQVIQGTAGSKNIGIAQEGQKGTPGVIGSDTTVAAESGDSIQVIGPGRVALAELGGTVARGDRLASDSNGKLVTFDPTAATSPEYIGYALQSGSSGNLIDILVLPGTASPITGGPASDVSALTDNSGGATADGTIGAIGTFTPSVAWNGSSVYPSAADATSLNTRIVALTDAVKELSTKVNTIRTNLRAVGLMS